MSIFEPNIEQITISEQVAVISDERWSLVSQMKTILLWNLCILNHFKYCIKASGKRTSLEPLQVKHAVMQINLIRHFGLRQIKLTANILKQSLHLSSFHQPRYFSNVIQPNVFMLRMFKAHCKNSNWNANILNPNITNRIMPILTYEQFCECNENLSQQVAIILHKLRRFSRLNFQ